CGGKFPLGYRVDDLEVGYAAGGLFEAPPLMAVAQQDEFDGRRIRTIQPCSVDHVVQALFQPHVPGMEDHDVVRTPTMAAAKLCACRGGGTGNVRPVADLADALLVDIQQGGKVAAESLVN